MKATERSTGIMAFATWVVALFSTVFGAAWVIIWIVGCVLAHGFWSTFFAVTTGGVWSAYLVVEKIMRAMGWA